MVIFFAAVFYLLVFLLNAILSKRTTNTSDNLRIEQQEQVNSCSGYKRLRTGLPNLKQIQNDISYYISHLNLHSGAGGDFELGIRWLLDNKNRLLSDADAIITESSHNSIKLPALSNGYLWVYSVMLDFISNNSYLLDEAEFTNYLLQINKTSSLMLKEGDFIQLCLKAAFLKKAGEAAKSIYESLKADEFIHELINDIFEGRKPDQELFNVLIKSNNHDLFYSAYNALSGLNNEQAANLVGKVDQVMLKRGFDKKALMQEVNLQHAKISSQASNCINSIIELNDFPFEKVIENTFEAEQLLLKDPNGTYVQSDRQTRALYKEATSKLSQVTKVSEVELLKTVFDLANNATEPYKREMGAYLLGKEKATLLNHLCIGRTGVFKVCKKKGLSGKLYFLVIFLFTLLFLLPLLYYTYKTNPESKVLSVIFVALLGAGPIVHLAQVFSTNFFNIFTKPTIIPRLKEKYAVKEENKTVLVIPCLLSSVDMVNRVTQQLEKHYLSNRCEHTLYALLGDFADSKTPTAPDDEEIVNLAKERIESFNKKYNTDVFLYYHRPRRQQQKDNLYICYERKRGALLEFTHLCVGKDSGGFLEISSSADAVKGVKYILTLDADTQLPPGVLPKLIGCIAHPLNKINYDANTKKILHGYGIIQASIGTTVPSAHKSRFAKLFAPRAGLDTYSCGASEVYQDLFGESTFTGKGIYSVDAYVDLIGHSLPENSILSHDLLEGAYLRCATASDIKLIDTFPANLISYYKRIHRWTRGDFQQLPWLFKYRRQVSALTKWKIISNILRGLFSACLLALMLLAITCLKGNAFIYTLFVICAVFFPLFIDIITKAILIYRSSERKYSYIDTIPDLKNVLLRMIYTFLFLPYDAFVTFDAAVRALYRMLISRKKMLEWTTSADSDIKDKGSLAFFMKNMWVNPVFGATYFLLSLSNGHGVFTALILFVLWAFGPKVGHYLSRQLEYIKEKLPSGDIHALRLLAARTLRFFYHAISEENNYLPPDNFQEQPFKGFADRTSPTNIGFGILAPLCGLQLRFIPLNAAVDMVKNAVDAADSLEKYQGNLFNWYTISTKEPMKPYYVSSIDSGNFCACCLCADELLSKATKIFFYDSNTATFYGQLLESIIDEDDDNKDLVLHLQSYQQEISKAENATELGQVLVRFVKDTLIDNVDGVDYVKWAYSAWLQLIENAQAIAGDVMVSLEDVLENSKRIAEDTSAALNEKAIKAINYFEDLANKITEVKAQIQKIISECDLSFMYNEKKKLFSIGYDFHSQKLSRHYYDLLASESRLFSYYSIAFGIAPAEHWFRLGRPMSRINDEPIILSWSGTMFEYLMPEIFLETHKETLMGKTISGVIQAQINYGKRERIPWGISESAFFAKDASNEYKYKAFGVYDTSLNTIRKERVISPYSTVMALEEVPKEAMDNVKRIVELGGAGRLGMIEALDFTKRSAFAENSGNYELVSTYMAHHQGMSLCALTNLLASEAVRKAFMGNRHIKAVELLLNEQIPQGIAPRVNTATQQKPRRLNLKTRSYSLPTPEPEVNVLSNSALTGVYTANGAAGLYYKNQALTLLSRDRVAEAGGTSVYIKDCEEGYVFSPCYLPLARHKEDKSCEFKLGQCSYAHERYGIKAKMNIILSSEHDTELREITISNDRNEAKEFIITLVHDVVLSYEQDYLAHPVYNNLFIETIKEDNVLIAKRRGKNDNSYIFMALTSQGEFEDVFNFTNKYNFYGRNNMNNVPERVVLGTELDGDVKSAPLEPILAQSLKVKLPPKGSKVVTFITVAADNKAKLDTLLTEFKNKPRFKQEAELAYANALLQERRLRLNDTERFVYSQILNSCFFIQKAGASDENSKIDLLWSMGISGDNPILLIKYDEDSDFYVLSKCLKMYEAIVMQNVALDLIVLDFTENDYLKIDHNKVETAIGLIQHNEKNKIVHQVVNYNGKSLLQKLLPMCSYYIDCSKSLSSIAHKDVSKGNQQEKLTRQATEKYPLSVIYNEKQSKLFDNGYGYFTEDGSEYVISLTNGASTPAPWSNIITNECFGTVVCENGGGFTYCKNSNLNRITNAYNNPVHNPPSECIFLRDEDSGEYWTITQSPINRGDQYQITHGFGYTRFSYCGMGLEQHQTVFVHPQLPLKLYSLKLINTSGKDRSLSITYYADIVLGRSKLESYKFLYAGENGKAVYVKRAEGGYAYLYMENAQYSYDRKAFLGVSGKLCSPEGMRYKNLYSNGNTDLCLCGRSFLTLDSNTETESFCVLGYAQTLEEMHEHIQAIKNSSIQQLLEDVKAIWRERLSKIQINTPDKALNVMFNGWLLYQTYTSRLFARSGFYQMGGAIGFRDQLQDCLALIYTAPEFVRQHILHCAEHQFLSGDVQHWWHPERTGIRTKIKDDLLFLPYVASRYAKITGDYGIFDEKVAYLEGREVGDAHDVYETPSLSEIKEPVYRHCIRAIKKACNFGQHGLPLIGTGDWNDGLDSVGDKGKGESVWLGWFLLDIMSDFMNIAKRYNDRGTIDEYKDIIIQLKRALEENAWDGRWYRRAYCDDGTPLGSAQNSECKIDSISQSWAVISGFGDHQRARAAMDNAFNLLVDQNYGLIKLLWPPFKDHKPYVGYIQKYLKGLRENGGQYTHAAAWMIKAFAIMGEGNKAYDLYRMINPIYHSENRAEANIYAVEPYVVAGDVYANADNLGRGGWSWYTGAAAWLYVIALENIIGFNLEGDVLKLNPCLPADWEVSFLFIYKNTPYTVIIKNPDRRQTGVKTIILDGEVQKDEIHLADDGKEHKVQVIMG